ncbi:hypothetical protein AK812_SmicGene18063 [Symbiodinium microadriaticum]|uniref:Uncharacterized protein n=1 Tax=Symbiodinium microadriaticum TaxID=2951 RepID=A0A1Q9DW31_SYMMI|nr:hypothetical protein AK812_SmicGene18063 [Symbiodinium microadriaticum]
MRYVFERRSKCPRIAPDNTVNIKDVAFGTVCIACYRCGHWAESDVPPARSQENRRLRNGAASARAYLPSILKVQEGSPGRIIFLQSSE